MNPLRRFSALALFTLLVFATGCTVDMKEGHPLGWFLMLLCVVLGLLVSLSPVKRTRTIRKPKDD